MFENWMRQWIDDVGVAGSPVVDNPIRKERIPFRQNILELAWVESTSTTTAQYADALRGIAYIGKAPRLSLSRPEGPNDPPGPSVITNADKRARICFAKPPGPHLGRRVLYREGKLLWIVPGDG